MAVNDYYSCYLQKSPASSAGVERAERDADNDRRHPDVHGVQRARPPGPGRLELRHAAVHVAALLPQRTQQRPRGVQLRRQLRRLLPLPATLPTPPRRRLLLSRGRGHRRTWPQKGGAT